MFTPRLVISAAAVTVLAIRRRRAQHARVMLQHRLGGGVLVGSQAALKVDRTRFVLAPTEN